MPESNHIPPLSQREQEHLTYLSVYELFNEAKIKKIRYKRLGCLFILLSGLVFLILMFSLESKIEFLVLWIITVIYCVVIMIRADYKYDLYKNLLGICDEFDLSELDDEEGEEEYE